MTIRPGRDILLKLDPGDGFRSVGGLRASRIALDQRTVDATTADSASRWRELMAAGPRSCTLSGAGLFRAGEADEAVRAQFFAAEPRPWRAILPGFGTIEGPFVVQALEYAGEHDGAAAYDVTLASSGALTFTPEAA